MHPTNPELVKLLVICRTDGPHHTEIIGEYLPEGHDAIEAAQMIRQNGEENETPPVFAKYRENMFYSAIYEGMPGTWENRPFRCYDFDKPWCLYDVLVVRNHGVHTYKTGIGACPVDAFCRQ
jgi:hypothetical protein